MILVLVALAATLRHVWRVGTTWNDHAVAVVVSLCFGVYAWTTPAWIAWPACGLLYGLFAAVDRTRGLPRPLFWTLGPLTQLAYGYALWAIAFAPLRLFTPWAWTVPAAVATWNVAWTVLRRDRVTHHRVPGLPLRVVQLSDVHVSGLMHEDQLRTLVARTNAAAPDLVVVTGDSVTPFSERAPEVLYRTFRELRAPVVVCLGNHDLPIRDALIAGFATIGARVLVDETVDVAGVSVTGADFRWTGLDDHYASLRVAAPGVPGRFRILLAHDPRLGLRVRDEDYDLVLSGHTHGGQVSAACFGVGVSLVRLLGGRDAGWFRTGRVAHYVHAGNWIFGLPPRLGVSPELAIFEPG